MSNPSLEQFVRDRGEALLSLDRAKIVGYLVKYGETPHPNEHVFWASVHKARTGAKTLPMAARIESKRWLTERGLSSFDDGDVPDEVARIAAAEPEGGAS